MRQLNPLGIRKLDVQQIRKARRKEFRELAKARTTWWFRRDERGALPLNEENVAHLVECAFDEAYEIGVRDGAKATRDRVAEALEAGRLVKP